MKNIIAWWNLIPGKFQLLLFFLGGLSLVLGIVYQRLSPDQKNKVKKWAKSVHNVVSWLDKKLDYADDWIKNNDELLSHYICTKQLLKAAEMLDQMVSKIRKEIEESGLVVTGKAEKAIGQKILNLTPAKTEGLKLKRTANGFKIDYLKKF